MKKVFSFILVASCVTILGVSCQKEIPTNVPEEKAEPQLMTITCAFPTMEDENGTKVSLDATGHTGWKEGDKIAIYGLRRTDQSDDTSMIDPIIHTLSADEVTTPQQAVFQVDISTLVVDDSGKDPYNAAYPAQDWSFYSDWYSSARAAFSNTNQLLLAGGLAADGTMTLHNLCGAIVFQVPNTFDFDSYVFYGNDGTEVVGYERYLVEVNKSTPNFLAKYGTATYGTLGDKTSISGPVVCDGTTLNYIFVPNEVTFAHGFTIAFVKGGDKVKQIKSKGALTLTHGHMVNLGLLPASKIVDYQRPLAFTTAEIAGATDLSADGTANCYVVVKNDTNAGKVFKFPAEEGNSGVELTGMTSVELLWETFNNATKPDKNDIIAKVDCKGKWIYFSLPASPKAGNAVIAAKNDSDEILWSWHIWVPSTAVNPIDNGIHKTVIQDRNLGALDVTIATTDAFIDVTTVGLFYQWGRKDPFPGPRQIVQEGTYEGFARVRGTEPTTGKVQITLDQSIKQPTFFARGYYNGSTQENPDWLTPSNSALWGDAATKTKYDPCPPGYRVPNREKSYPLWADESSTHVFSDNVGWTYNNTNYWFTVGNPATVFPCVGYNDGGTAKTAFRTIIWNAHEDSGTNEYGFAEGNAYARRVYYESSTVKFKNSSVGKSLGGSVRCVAE